MYRVTLSDEKDLSPLKSNSLMGFCPGNNRRNQYFQQQSSRGFFSLRNFFEEVSENPQSRKVVVVFVLISSIVYGHRMFTKPELEPSSSDPGPNPRMCVLRDVKTMIVNSPLICSEGILKLLESFK